jgi:hypothetical protein
MTLPFEYEDDEEFPDDEEIRCKYCNERYLRWDEARGERNQKVFVLVTEDGAVHNCPAFAKPSIHEFEDFE